MKSHIQSLFSLPDSFILGSMGEILASPLSYLVYAVSLVVAITIHEFAHAYIADRLGDPTPRLQGRLTLNPLAHLDPLGTIMLFLVRFGWGKPVEFDPFNLRNPRRDGAMISLAGPASNLTAAVFTSILLRFFPPFQYLAIAHGTIASTIAGNLIFLFLQSFVVLNVILAIFNLVPIHPLDGFKIVGGFLTRESAREWYKLERYGILMLLVLFLPLSGNSSLIHQIISPPINILLSLLLPQQPLI